jgi:hypothetical protein
MPRGYRHFVFALVGWLSLAAVAPDNRGQTKDSQAAANIQRPLESIASAQNKIATATDTGEYQKPCKDGQANDQSDLCAQWYAARAARDAATWTYWGTLVSIAGAVGIVLALYLTVDSNRIARSSARRELRAYITFSKFSPTVGEGETRMQLEWINRGQTPARHANSSVDWIALDSRLPADFDFPPPDPADDDDGPMNVGPGQILFATCDRRMPHQLIADVSEEKKRVYIWGAVDYVDAFGSNRRTEIAARMSAEHLGGLEYGTRWTALHRHNGIDEHCEKKGAHSKRPLWRRFRGAP